MRNWQAAPRRKSSWGDGPALDKSRCQAGRAGNDGRADVRVLAASMEVVKINKGMAGVDGWDIPETTRQLQTAWLEIRQQLLQGTYRFWRSNRLFCMTWLDNLFDFSIVPMFGIDRSAL